MQLYLRILKLLRMYYYAFVNTCSPGRILCLIFVYGSIKKSYDIFGGICSKVIFFSVKMLALIMKYFHMILIFKCSQTTFFILCP